MVAQAPLLIALCAPLLLYLPGWAVSRRSGAPADGLERHFERVAVSALWSGWLALLLAQLGLFSLWLHLIVTVAASALLARGGRRPASPLPLPRWQLLVYGAVLALALLLVARPFEVVLGVRDAGVYANTGFAIARTGALVQSDPLLADLGQRADDSDPQIANPARQAITNYTIGQPRERYIASRLRAAGFFVYEGELPRGRVVPQGLHLLPAWIALFSALGGPAAGLFAVGALGWLGVWSVGMLGRRLAGPRVGWLAMAFLALNGVQVWFARYSTAETVAQFLIWAGLFFFAVMHDPASDTASRQRAAVLAGLAVGQVALARLDFFLLGPLALYLVYIWISQRWERWHTLLTLALGLMLGHAALHVLLIARAYVFDTGHERLLRDSALVALASLPFLTPEVRETFLSSPRSALVRPFTLPAGLSLGAWARLALEGALLGAGVATLLALRARASSLRRIENALARSRTPLLRATTVALVLLAGYAYLVRPQILDADIFFNTRGGWNDPLTRDPELVADDVRTGRMTIEEARTMAGVALVGNKVWEQQPDLEATAALRARLAEERGPWRGPLSNQTLNWLRLQGYVGAPVRLPVQLWYDEYNGMSWWQRLMTDPATFTSQPEIINEKYRIPLANFVRVGWYLSPLGVALGCVGYALWWRRGLSPATWLFLSVSLLGTFFYVRQTYGTGEQHYIYILRRFVPITYPALSLGMAYALVALAAVGRRRGRSAPFLQGAVMPGIAVLLGALQLAFFIVTNRPIFFHTEYRGALAQLDALARQFRPGSDVLLLRGGAPIHARARDIPDLVATPLRFAYGLDAFAVKSAQPGNYAADLALQARHWRDEGREVYLMLSASGGSFALPGFDLEPAGAFTLDLPEFEQLTDQKPRNVSRLTLPFVIYRLVPGAPGVVATAGPSLSPGAFAAQVTGFYRPEATPAGRAYAWTNGEASLRLPWPADATAGEVWLELGAGERPAHLGPARVCLSALPETSLWPTTTGAPLELGCFAIGAEPGRYRVRLDPARLPPAPTAALLLQLTGKPWVPAAEDPRQNDRRDLGVQMYGVEMATTRP
ncbi:MAG: hypothetical protein SNJ69_08765 [Chloroflexaceae bacterium]